MFATLLGGLPWPELETGLETDLGRAIEAVVRAQEAAGLEPITDGRLADPAFDGFRGELPADPGRAAGSVVARWRTAAGLTDRAVKQALPGPYTLARPFPDPERAARTREAAERVAGIVGALADAGCPLIEIEESTADRIGADEGERELFRDAHRRVVEGGGETHLSLSIAGSA